mmetsp:Transcript_66792/g.193401  ORF Transcript_66792/g.193401 Transcript_66792/m.193401 type:complete len:230 (+) Transcript_66792:447-1136(+)
MQGLRHGGLLPQLRLGLVQRSVELMLGDILGTLHPQGEAGRRERRPTDHEQANHIDGPPLLCLYISCMWELLGHRVGSECDVVRYNDDDVHGVAVLLLPEHPRDRARDAALGDPALRVPGYRVRRRDQGLPLQGLDQAYLRGRRRRRREDHLPHRPRRRRHLGFQDLHRHERFPADELHAREAVPRKLPRRRSRAHYLLAHVRGFVPVAGAGHVAFVARLCLGGRRLAC